MATKVSVNFDGLEKIQDRLTSEKLRTDACSVIISVSDDYAPFKSGYMKNTGHPVDGGTAIEYNGPYAKYLWYGKLMVDPISGKGAFFSPGYGFWSRRNVKKVLTEQDLNFNEAPTRGARWVERSWVDKREQILEAVKGFILEDENDNH